MGDGAKREAAGERATGAPLASTQRAMRDRTVAHLHSLREAHEAVLAVYTTIEATGSPGGF